MKRGRSEIKKLYITYSAIALLLLQTALSGAIPRNVKLELDSRFIPAYRTGNLETVVFSGALIANQVGGALYGEIDTYLEEQNIGSLGSVLARARFTLLTQNRAVKPEATAKELLLTVPHFQNEVQQVIDGELRPLIMQDEAEPPATLKDLEEALWNVHIYKNDLTNLDRTAILAAQTVRTVLLSGQVKPIDRDKLSFDFVSARNQVIDENENRLDHEMALRVTRVRLAKNVLDTSAELDQRLQAAFAMDQDLKIIRDFVEHQRKGLFPRVPTPNLDLIEQTVVSAERENQQLFMTANQFFTGLHWWIRGRYGKGVAANGLLKGEHVKQNPAAGFALSMPRNRTLPTDPFAEDNSERSPYVARRHENTWSWENGGISMMHGEEIAIVAESDYFY